MQVIAKPARRGEFTVLVQPLDEYRQYIEKDAARTRFQKVLVHPPSVEDGAILRGIKNAMNFTMVSPSEIGIIAAATQSE